MKTLVIFLLLLLTITSRATAATLYVSFSGTNPVPPYADWSTAAVNIQDAIDAASPGDQIIVNDGIYATGGTTVNNSAVTNRVAVNKAVTVQSVNGPAVTVIDGGSVYPEVAGLRCVYLASGATLIGFTLTNGTASANSDPDGGGVWCESVTATVSNCVISGNLVGFIGSGFTDGNGAGAYGGTLNNCTLTVNVANNLGGGGGAANCTLNNCVLTGNFGNVNGGGALNCTLNNCTLTTNSTDFDGGGAYGCTLNNCVLAGNVDGSGGGGAGAGAAHCTLNNCTLTGNNAGRGYAGGAYDCTLNNCTLTGNYGDDTGGGAVGCTLNNCTLMNNVANFTGGGAVGCTLNNCTLTGNQAGDGGGAWNCTLNNCTLTGNTATAYFYYNGGQGGGAIDCTLNNCTLTGNSAEDGSYYDPTRSEYYTDPGNGGGAYGCTLNNCIAYYNSASVGTNYDSSSTLNYCCTTPLPTNGIGNITNEPLFVDYANGNLHLQSNSPCINAGDNAYVTNSTDLDGNPRIVGGTVDIGAYECQSPLTMFFVNASNANPAFPYSTWDTAATNIQDAVDAATIGAQVLVTNGIYQAGGNVVVLDSISNVVAITKPVTVQSINGPAVTVIDGGDEMRCVYLAAGATLTGFTLTNGEVAGTNLDSYSGGGVWCESISSTVSNCVISGNLAYINPYEVAIGSGGGGAYGGTLNRCMLTGNSSGKGGGAFGSTLNNCTLTGNRDIFDNGGGAAYCTLNNCILSNNIAGASSGGGAILSTLNNCTLIDNFAGDSGGGAAGCTLNNCILTGNEGDFGGGANSCTLNNCTLTGNGADLGGGAFSSTLNSCTLTGNNAGFGGGVSRSTLNNCTLTGNGAESGGGAFGSTLNNCTLTGNSAGGGSHSDGGGAHGCDLNNCIVYYNSAPEGTNYDSSCTLNYCCTTPDPGGIGNITNEPLFIDYASGDLRLQSDSPCINSGDNAYAPAGPDLDGKPRIVGGTVDVGAYEYQTPTSVLSYAWAQQYGLPTDGSVDYADFDSTGMNNWQKSVAGLNPNNSASVLVVLPPMATNDPSGLVVSWQSVDTRMYFLQCSTNLAAQPAFSTIRSNTVGQAGTTSLLDTNAVGIGPYFYRVGVQ